jgi:hypothetical protein
MKILTIKELHKLSYYEISNLWEDLLYNRDKTEKEENYFYKVDKVKAVRAYGEDHGKLYAKN